MNREAPPIVRFGSSGPKTGNEASRDYSGWIIVGRVAKVIGLDGWVRVLSLSDNPERFLPGAEFSLLNNDRAPSRLEIAEMRDSVDGSSYDLRFEGVETREEAEDLLKKELFVKREERFEPGNDRFFPDEVEGMAVLSKDGRVEGRVECLNIDGPCPFLQVQSVRHGELLIPFRKAFVAEVRRKERQIVLTEPIEMHIPEDIRDH